MGLKEKIHFQSTLWLILITLGLTLSIQVQAVSKDEFRWIKEISETFLKECPPATCVLIGVGRSPTPFMAYIQGLPQSEIKNYAWNIPLSEFRYGVDRNKPLDPGLQEKLFRHFDQYLPSPSQLKGKSVLVIDCASNKGASTRATKNYLQSYFNTRATETHQIAPLVSSAVITSVSGSPMKLHQEAEESKKKMLEILEGPNDPERHILLESEHLLNKLKLGTMTQPGDFRFRFNHVIVIPSESPLNEQLSNQSYDEKAEFGSYKIKEDKNNNTKNQAYSDLVSDLKKMREEYSHESQNIKNLNSNLDFVAIEQNEKLGTFSEAKSKDIVSEYLIQLESYHGPDQENRYWEVFQDPDTKWLLFNAIPEIHFPQLQDEIAAEIIRRGDKFGLRQLAYNLRDVGPELREKYARILISNPDTDVRNSAWEAYCYPKPPDLPIEPKKAFTLLKTLLEHNDPKFDERFESLLQGYLTRAIGKRSMSPLEEALKSQEPKITAIAGKVLETLICKDKDKGSIHTLLNSTDSGIRKSVAKILKICPADLGLMQLQDGIANLPVKDPRKECATTIQGLPMTPALKSLSSSVKALNAR